MTITRWLAPAPQMSQAIASDIRGFGGFLRCETCGEVRDLGDVANSLGNGWPEHCGRTMHWWTEQQVDAGEHA